MMEVENVFNVRTLKVDSYGMRIMTHVQNTLWWKLKTKKT